VNQSWGSEKIILCIVCFAYSLLPVVVVVVVVVHFLSYQVVVISAPEFYLLSISSPLPAEAEGEG